MFLGVSVQFVRGETNPLNHHFTLSGKLTDAQTREPIAFASVSVHGSTIGTTTNIHGEYQLILKNKGYYTMIFSCLGYQEVDTVIHVQQDMEINLFLEPRSFSLDEVTVTAQENTNDNASSVIGTEAMQHIQPSSFADLLQLLPGGMTKDIKMTGSSHMSLRQAGTDINTGLGTAFVIDGMQMSNDALQHVYGNTTQPTTSYGIDMRTISTDRIEKVEVVRGIPSVEYGNLTSGLVLIDLKNGETPWEGRVKTDYHTKLFSVGKGFLLPANGGSVNLDVEHTQYLDDPRSKLLIYSRTSASGRYKKIFEMGTKNRFEFGANFTYTGSFDREKSDPDLMKGKDDYEKNKYQGFSLSSSGKLRMPGSLIHETEYNLSASYNQVEMERKHLIAPGIMPVPTAMESGVYDAEYLPAQYSSFLRVDGKPLTLSAKVTARAEPNTGALKHGLLAGAEWTYDVNLGRGELYDLTRPPYVGGRSTRPRPYRDIPAIQKLSVYAEDRLKYPVGGWLFSATAGLRATTLPDLSGTYDISGRWYAEPRLNASIGLPAFAIGNNKVKIELTGGVGHHYRFPTQAQLYPADLYFDYVQLNYYSQQEELRALNIRTYVEDPTNYALTPSLNKKYETGIRVGAGQYRISLTYFDEWMKNGFSAEQTILFHTYDRYDPSSVDPNSISSKPGLSQFDPPVADTVASLFNKARNTALVHKRGLEYTLRLGKIKILYTEIHINGAWFRTEYRQNSLRYRKPTGVYNGKLYPYVGVYDYNNTDNRIRQQFNTNMKLITHIPVLAMIFSTDLQTMWFTRTSYRENSGMPLGYIDLAGQYHEFDPGRSGEAMMHPMVDTYMSYYFKPDKVPIAMKLHLKLTKEIGRHFTLSFYVNNLLNYIPDYTGKEGTERTRKSEKYPSFGAELTVKL
ncbi:MAG: TonB-dependent receptor [Bacteroidales bacterium]|nr:TonB-dependent receptor [Bacteroidales bacterium]